MQFVKVENGSKIDNENRSIYLVAHTVQFVTDSGVAAFSFFRREKGMLGQNTFLSFYD